MSTNPPKSDAPAADAKTADGGLFPDGGTPGAPGAIAKPGEAGSPAVTTPPAVVTPAAPKPEKDEDAKFVGKLRAFLRKAGRQKIALMPPDFALDPKAVMKAVDKKEYGIDELSMTYPGLINLATGETLLFPTLDK